jgi:hypothetical protein
MEEDGLLFIVESEDRQAHRHFSEHCLLQKLFRFDCCPQQRLEQSSNNANLVIIGKGGPG